MSWNGSGGPQKKEVQKKETKPFLSNKVLISFAFVILGSFAGFLYFNREGESVGLEQKKKQVGSKKIEDKVNKKPQKVKDVKEDDQTKSKVSKKILEVPKGYVVVTNAGHELVMTEKEAEIFRKACKDSTLRTRTERHLRLLACIPPGMPAPPMPDMVADEMDKDITATILNKIEILPDDTDREIQQKEFVIAFKEYMKEEIKNGKKPSEVYREYVKIMNDVAYLTTEGLKQARELQANGDEDGAKVFIELVNKKIEQIGGQPNSIDLNKRGPQRKSGPIGL